MIPKTNTFFASAITSGNINDVKSLIDNGADVNAPMNLTNSNDPFVKMMVKKTMLGRRNINLTPLILAISSNKIEIVKLLIEHGANAKEALAWAINSGRTRAVELIINNGVNVDTPLDMTNFNQDPFISLDAMILGMNRRDVNTPLVWALKYEKPEIIKLLIEQGANANEALVWAINSGRTRAVELLINNGVNVNAPLNLTNSNDPFFRLMLRRAMLGHNTNLTPLVLAIKKNRPEIAKLLIGSILLQNFSAAKPYYIQNNEDLSNFWDGYKPKCDFEVSSLKKVILSKKSFGSLSLWDLYTGKDENKLAIAFTDKTIKNQLEKFNFIEKFPYMGKKIENQILVNLKKGEARTNFLELADKCTLSTKDNSAEKESAEIFLYPDVQRKILEFLPSVEVKKFLGVSLFKSDKSVVSAISNLEANEDQITNKVKSFCS